MELSVAVVNWNSGDCLGRLLASLRPLLPELLDVVIIDNASDDGSPEPVRGSLGVQLFPLETNLGFAAGANAAVSRTRGAWILLLNPDVEIDPESVRRLYRRGQQSPEAAILCGPLLDSEGRSQADFQLRPLPTAWSVLRDVLFLDELMGLFKPKGRASPSWLTEVEQPAAAYWLLRREAWDQLGGFDTSFYPAWFEDVDFCRRLRDSGWKILFAPDCPARHEGGASLRRMSRAQFYRAFYGNLLRYLQKHHQGSFPLLWLPVKLGTWIRVWLVRK